MSDGARLVQAVVVPKPGASVGAEELVAHCRTLIAGYKCPRSVELRGRRCRSRAAGKVEKRALREPYWQGSREGGELGALLRCLCGKPGLAGS